MPPTSTDVPTRQNNPGDLKSGGSITSFSDPKQGMAALVNDLYAKQTGNTSTGLTPTSTLADFASKYAPKSDGNDPAQYTANLANQMGVSPATQLKDLDLGKWADAVSKNEGFVAGSSQGQIQQAPVSTDVSDSVGGYAPPPQPGQVNSESSDDAGGYAPPPLPPSQTQGTTVQPPPAPGYFSRVGSDISGGIQQGATDIAGNAAIANSNASPLTKLGSSIDTGLNVAGDVTGAVASPLSEAVSPIVGGLVNAIPGGAAVANSVGGAIQGISKQFPNAGRAVGDIANVAGVVTGGAGAGLAEDAVKSGAARIGGAAAGEASVEDVANTIAPKMTAKQTASAIAERGGTKSGILGKITVNPDPYLNKVAQSVKELVPDFKPKASLVENINATKNAISTEAQNLKSQVIAKGENVPYDINDLKEQMDSIPKDLTLQSDDKMSKLFDLTKNKAIEIAQQKGTNVASLLDARQAFDQLVDKEIPNLYDKEYSPMRTAVTSMRNAMTNFTADRIPDVGLKDSLTKQSHLFTAVDNMSAKAASGADKEIGTNAVSRFVKAHPLVSSAASTGAGYLGADKGIKLIEGLLNQQQGGS